MNAIAARITGIQHIGLPTNDIEKTIEFYKALGFEVASTCDLPTDKVAFLKLKNICIETYQGIGEDYAKGFDGAIDHICVDVDDIEATWEAVKAAGLKPMADEIEFLPFWEKGVRFFKVLDPNNAPVEFCQIL